MRGHHIEHLLGFLAEELIDSPGQIPIPPHVLRSALGVFGDGNGSVEHKGHVPLVLVVAGRSLVLHLRYHGLIERPVCLTEETVEHHTRECVPHVNLLTNRIGH